MRNGKKRLIQTYNDYLELSVNKTVKSLNGINFNKIATGLDYSINENNQNVIVNDEINNNNDSITSVKKIFKSNHNFNYIVDKNIERNDGQNILLFSAMTDNYQDQFINYTILKNEYCQKHGYSFLHTEDIYNIPSNFQHHATSLRLYAALNLMKGLNTLL